MTDMSGNKADSVGAQIAAFIQSGQILEAIDLLEPLLMKRSGLINFAAMGKLIGECPRRSAYAFFDYLATIKNDRGFILLGAGMNAFLSQDLLGVLERCRVYICAAGIWYLTDILAESVPGPALVEHFHPAAEALTGWQADKNRWVHRALGMAVQFWAKNARDSKPQKLTALLALLDPLFEEKELQAVKGVSLGYKALGEKYPAQMIDWLGIQLQINKRYPLLLMIRKAIEPFSEAEQKRLLACID